MRTVLEWVTRPFWQSVGFAPFFPFLVFILLYFIALDVRLFARESVVRRITFTSASKKDILLFLYKRNGVKLKYRDKKLHT